MKAKVNCSALYPYFDSLIINEDTLEFRSLTRKEYTCEHTSSVIYVKEKLEEIFELFQGVILDLTLEEVKILYFKRKVYKKDSKGKIATKTKEVKELCIGDEIYLFFPYGGYERWERITKLQEFSSTTIRIITEQGTEAIFLKDKVVSLTE